MVDAARSSEPGRELARLGRVGDLVAMLEPSRPERRREADGLGGPASPARAVRERPGRASSRNRAREIVASTIWSTIRGAAAENPIAAAALVPSPSPRYAGVFTRC